MVGLSKSALSVGRTAASGSAVIPSAMTKAETVVVNCIGNGYSTGNHNNGTTNNVSAGEISKRVSEAAEILAKSKVVCFDVDSTVIKEEGIDELALFCGKGLEVSKLTKEAMQGSMTFQDALKRRLDIINPSQKQIRDFIKANPSSLSPGIADLMSYLRSKNIDIFLVSGGFDCLIEPVAERLDIPFSNVFANKLLFNFNGDYFGFDTNQPTSRSGGKADAIAQIKQRYTNENVIVTMIGDGATDLEASPPANHFIGYGGNIVRQEVRNRSTYYATNFQNLMKC